MKKILIVVFSFALMFFACADKKYCYECSISMYYEPISYIYTYPKTETESVNYCDVTEDDIDIIKKSNNYTQIITIQNIKTKVTHKMTCKEK